MTDERIFTVKKVARQTWAAEDQIDKAIEQLAELMAALPVARQQCKLSAVVGTSVFSEAAAAMSALTTARARLVDMHNELDQVRKAMGFRETALGCGINKPALSTATGAVAEQAAVRAA